MKKKLLPGLGLLLMTWALQAQVVITLQLPPLGLTIKPQLWNMSLVNTTGAPITAQVQMVISDAGTGHTVLTGTTPTFLLTSGVNVKTTNSLSPISYTPGTGYSIDPNPDGFLPVGVYNICYTLIKWTNDISEQVAEECITAEVEPISPPQLMQPGDSDQVIVKRPFFTWLPPTPYNSFGSLTYDWTLVEVGPTQTAAVAIEQNIPVLLQPNISFTNLQYPLSMPELDTGKIYAWRVTAKNNDAAVASSEIWTFKIHQFSNDTFSVPGKGYYAALRRQQDASYVISGDLLRFQYNHDLNSSAVQIKITDISNNHHNEIQLDSSNLNVKYGLNYIALDVGSRSGITDRHMYLLELVNDYQEHWFLKFEYRRPVEQ
jgi:hypothetical protein